MATPPCSILASPTVAPAIPLAGAADGALYAGGAEVLLGGWGLTSANAGSAPDALRSTANVVLNAAACKARSKSFYRPYSASVQMCTTDPPDHASGGCFGDSGGPVIAHRPDGSPVEIGIVSTGGPGCSTKLPNIFTRADRVSTWTAEWIAATELGAPPPTLKAQLPALSSESARGLVAGLLSARFGELFTGAQGLRWQLPATRAGAAEMRTALALRAEALPRHRDRVLRAPAEHRRLGQQLRGAAGQRPLPAERSKPQVRGRNPTRVGPKPSQVASPAVTSGFTELASVDGTVTPTGEAMVPMKDDGLYRGDGAFEVIRLYDGKPFALVDHLDRLGRSAAAIELEFDRAALEAEIAALLDRAGPVDGQLRLIVTRGGRRIAATEPIPDHAETLKLATVTYNPTVILNGVKSLSYAANMQASRLAKGRGADEAVLVRPDGTVLEPPTSAIFWVAADGELRTPALDDGVLESITRDRLIKALDVAEGSWNVEDLRAASEAFLASTTREIQAVAAIDGADLPAAPGPRTEEAKRAFAETLGRELRGLQ